jgi:hypothetical protein
MSGDNRLPRIEGCGVWIYKSVQTAIDQAGESFRRRFGAEPTHVALPSDIGRDGLNLGALNLGHPSGPGMVIVGRLATVRGVYGKPLQRGPAPHATAGPGE